MTTNNIDYVRINNLTKISDNAFLVNEWTLGLLLFVMYEGVSTSFRNHPKVKEQDISFLYLIDETSLKMQSYTFFRLVIDCPQTKIVKSVHDTRNWLHTIMHINVWAPPEMYFESILSMWDQQNWPNVICHSMRIRFFLKQFWWILKLQIYNLSYHFGLWSVNKK